MTIGTKFNIGDEVWVKAFGKPQKVTIQCIQQERNRPHTYNTYELRNEKVHMWAGESFLFKSKEEVR